MGLNNGMDRIARVTCSVQPAASCLLIFDIISQTSTLPLRLTHKDSIITTAIERNQSAPSVSALTGNSLCAYVGAPSAELDRDFT